MNESVVWSQPPEGEAVDDDGGGEQEGELDESLAMRRLRRWLSGMFGVSPRDTDKGSG